MNRLVSIVTLVSLATSLAVAQPAPDDRAKAASHFKQAELYFKAKDWDHALAEYEAAFVLSKEPLLVFNMALCHDRAQRPEKALEMFQRYLDLQPSGPVADEAREDVARLTPAVEKIRAERDAAARAEAERKAEADRQASEARKADEARRAADERQRIEAARAQRHQRAQPLESRARIEKWIGIGLAGAGAISLGVGIKYGLDARSAARDINGHDMGDWTPELIAIDKEGERANTKMIVFTSIAGGLFIGGALSYWLGVRTARRAETLLVGAVPTYGGGAFVLGGSF